MKKTEWESCCENCGKEKCKEYKWVICGDCDGEGQVDNPNFSQGFTSDEMAEMGEDFYEDYMAGHYDVVCPSCRGSGKVKTCPEIEKWLRACWEMEAERQAEIRMGC